MEIGDEVIINLYRTYLNDENNINALETYKNNNFFIDLLYIFVKYQFNYKDIIQQSVKNNALNKGYFMIYFLNNFINYFYSLNINLTKDLFKKEQNSYFRFIISYIIKNKNDKIENYSTIYNNINSMDKFYEDYLNEIFMDFIEYCKEYVLNNKISQDIGYIFKVFDFFSNIREGNKNDEFYLFIKPLLFEDKSDIIKGKLDINKYKDKEKIKNDIILIINKDDKFGDIEYEYIKFIKNCVKEINKSNDKFKILYFNLLNEEKLELYIQTSNNIKNYDLTKIIITNNITNENIQINNNIMIINYDNNVNNFINNDNLNEGSINDNNIKNNDNIEQNSINNNNINSNMQNNNNNNIYIDNNIINKKNNNNIVINEITKNDNTNNTVDYNKDNIQINNTNINENNNLINDNIDNSFSLEEQNKDLINSEGMIYSLKQNLIKFSIKDYFIQQIKKYEKELPDNSFIKNFQNENLKIKHLVSNSINKYNFPIVHDIFSNLLNYINNPKNNYNKNFGFIVIDKTEFIYAYHNDEIINSIIFEASKIKECDYEHILKSKNFGEIEKNNSENNSAQNYRKNNINYISNNSYSGHKSYKSYGDNQINGNNDDKNNGYKLTILKGLEFENNSTYLFKNLFDLKDLPNYFFVINKEVKEDINKKNHHKNSNEYKGKKRSEAYNFSDYNKNLFSIFIETDGAYINDKNEKLIPKLKNNYHPFLIQNTFEIYKNGEKYELRLIDENLDIEPKTIVINESKLSIPKNIDNFNLEEKYEKDLLEKTLIATLNKLIRKSYYYSKFVEKEILKDSNEIKDYKFLLCLIYNNIPIKNIDDIAKKDLQILIDNDYINNKFKLKIIYLIPNLGTYNLNYYQKEMDNKLAETRRDMEKQHQSQMKDMENQNQIKMEQLKRDMENQNQIKMEQLKRDMENQNQIKMDVMQKSYQKEIDELNIKINQMQVNYNELLNKFDKLANDAKNKNK